MQPEEVFSQYSEQEKTAYLSVIASLATADRQATQAEGEFLQEMSQVAGLSSQGAQQVLAAAQDSTNQTIQANLDQLRNSNLRYSLVTDLVSFARADGSYTNEEEAMVNKIAAYLGVNQQQVQALETVATETQQAHAQNPSEAPRGLMDSLGDKLRSVGIPPQTALTGLLAVAAPLVLSRVMGGRGGMGGGMMGGGGTLGGLLGGAAASMGGSGTMGGLLGGLMNSGGLGGMLGGATGGYGSRPAGYGMAGGGLGGLMSVLGGLGGGSHMGPRSTGGGGLGGLMGGGMGSLLGGLLGGR